MPIKYHTNFPALLWRSGAYRVDVGISRVRRKRAVGVDQIAHRKRSAVLTTCGWNLLLEYERPPIRVVFQISVPHGSFNELLVGVDSTTFHLHRVTRFIRKLNYVVYKVVKGEDGHNDVVEGVNMLWWCWCQSALEMEKHHSHHRC